MMKVNEGGAIAAVILAAGKGTRMKSDLPKVLHHLAGRPLLDHVLDTVDVLGVGHTVVVVGHEAKLVQEKCNRPGLTFVKQEPQLGTGHAVQVAVPYLDRTAGCLILAGDVPLLQVDTLRRIIAVWRQAEAAAVVLTCIVEDAGTYGRIIKDSGGRVLKIVEARDATIAELAVREYNTGVFCFRSDLLREALTHLKQDNAQGEYYLTDTVAYLVDNGFPVLAVSTENAEEVIGINTLTDLAAAEGVLARRGES